MENIFGKLNAIDVTKHVKGKNGLSFLSWAWAWGELKKEYPTATYKIWKDEKNMPFVYDETLGYMVFTEITIGGLTHEMWLFVMDGANKSMLKESYSYKTKYGDKKVQACTMFDINKTIMRCLVKNIGMFGLGLYIYAGEDLPEQIEEDPPPPPKKLIKAEEIAKETEIIGTLQGDIYTVIANIQKAKIAGFLSAPEIVKKNIAYLKVNTVGECEDESKLKNYLKYLKGIK